MFKGWEPPADTAVHCAFCLRPAPESGGTRCQRCQVVYHSDCWTANRSRCAVYGCEPGVPARPAATAPRPRIPVASPAPARSGGNYTWVIIFVCISLVRAGGSWLTSRPSSPSVENLRMNRDWNVQRQVPVPPEFLNLDADGVIVNSVESYTRALESNPRSVRAREGRAYLQYDRQEWRGALEDFRQALELEGAHDDYLWLRIWLIQARTGERGAADQALSTILDARFVGYNGTWEGMIAQYLVGRKSESDLLYKAVTPPRECQALYYIASRRLIEGDREGAREFFLRCADTRQENYREYHSAVAELRALR